MTARVALVLVLAAGSLSPALAGDGSDQDSGFWSKTLQVLNLKPKPSDAPTFVTTTRRTEEDLHYMPTGQARPKRSVAVKSAGEVEAAKQALDSARQAQLGPKPAPTAKPTVKKAARSGSGKPPQP